MKYDMGGAAMCFAAACAIARLKLPLRVTVLTPLAENAISGEAFMNTSILTTRSGKTIEVHSTDAEGRLLLADALVLASERKPDWIVDAATLTGACVVGLGEDIAGALGTDTDFTQALVKAGVDVGEWFWELPLHLPYIECMKTTVADVKNSAGHRWGGAITAAVFLKEWVPDGQKWVHCDIAGRGARKSRWATWARAPRGLASRRWCGSRVTWPEGRTSKAPKRTEKDGACKRTGVLSLKPGMKRRFALTRGCFQSVEGRDTMGLTYKLLDSSSSHLKDSRNSNLLGFSAPGGGDSQ
jgi:hypothetical protein